MILGSKHVGAILNVLKQTILCMCISWCANWMDFNVKMWIFCYEWI